MKKIVRIIFAIIFSPSIPFIAMLLWCHDEKSYIEITKEGFRTLWTK